PSAPSLAPVVSAPPPVAPVASGEGSMASAVAGLTGEPPPPPSPSAPNAKPRGVDLAEIDRYLEGLGKL
ncbi:MAG: hypothetical protein ACOZQL_06415, partial [Myxococcota bacterium]